MHAFYGGVAFHQFSPLDAKRIDCAKPLSVGFDVSKTSACCGGGVAPRRSAPRPLDVLQARQRVRLRHRALPLGGGGTCGRERMLEGGRGGSGQLPKLVRSTSYRFRPQSSTTSSTRVALNVRHASSAVTAATISSLLQLFVDCLRYMVNECDCE